MQCLQCWHTLNCSSKKAASARNTTTSATIERCSCNATDASDANHMSIRGTRPGSSQIRISRYSWCRFPYAHPWLCMTHPNRSIHTSNPTRRSRW